MMLIVTIRLSLSLVLLLAAELLVVMTMMTGVVTMVEGWWR